MAHEKTEGTRRARGLGPWSSFAAALLLGCALIVAIVQNSRPVGLRYLAWHVNVSLIAILLATALAAVLLDELGGLIWRRRRASLVRRAELEQLRATRELPGTPQAAEPPTLTGEGAASSELVAASNRESEVRTIPTTHLPMARTTRAAQGRTLSTLPASRLLAHGSNPPERGSR